MKALRSFTVRPSLPAELTALEELAMNLRGSWDDQTRDLFRWGGPEQCAATIHAPVRLLGLVPRERLESLAADPGFMRFLDEVHTELSGYLSKPRWFQAREGTTALQSVAYFSPEFGIAEALPQYSGGLGVLAGDHLKAASDLGVPLVGVGLFYRHGYFRQELSIDGWQQEGYPDLDPYAMALMPVDGVRLEVDIAGLPLSAAVWKAEVGRVPLFLLDADVEENSDHIRQVTDRLYGGDDEHRLRQEILLGIGGVRALQRLGVATQVFHTNEGHAGFLGLERIRQAIVEHGLPYADAIEAVRAASIFTTHTPVPAGIDRFPPELIEKYFSGWAAECGLTVGQLLEIGHRVGDPPTERFNMAVMGLRLAARSNAVSQLHGEVSREMFSDLWPDVPADEIPITSVTNGVHAKTWVSAEMSDLLSRYVLPEWDEAGTDRWARIAEARDDEVWRAKEQGRQQLVAFVRRRLRESALARGLSPSDCAWVEEVLDGKALTICFARRFATYKRATLLVSQPDRLTLLVLAGDRPVQFVFAGKAHPADETGKEMIRRIVAFSADLRVRHSFVFLEDYDIAVARALYQGADVWLNTPRRPQEACGTSGMKAALNGGLNASILDGWWDELFNGENGWAISSAEQLDDETRRDEVEVNSLFEILEHQVVPMFYERVQGPVPRRWVQRIKSSLCSLGPEVTAARMVRDYVERLYEPTAAQADRLAANEFAPARELAAWKQRVIAGWDDVEILSVETDVTVASLGADRSVDVEVALGAIEPSDIEVQLLHGPVGQNDELDHPTIAAMVPSADGTSGRRYHGAFSCERAGRYGFTVRVVPAHGDLVSPVELGRIAWA